MFSKLVMKNSSKVSIPILFLLLGNPLAYSQIKIGPEVGANFAMQRQTYSSVDSSSTDFRNSTLKVGALAGVNVDIKVLKNCYVQTGLFYTYDNIKFKDSKDFTKYGLGNVAYEQQDDIHYFRVPLYIMYKSGFDGSGRFMAGIGPYVGYAFLANRSTKAPYVQTDTAGVPTGAIGYVKTNQELQLGNNSVKDQMRNWDYGVNACIGYESNVGMFFRGSFNWGFQNLYPGHSGSGKLKNWGTSITIGFNIGKDDW